jgi:hypothetical protein
MKEKIIKTPNTQITYRVDGIIHLHYFENLITIKESKEIFKAIRENSPWDVSPLYISGDTFSSLDKESKDFFASEIVLRHCSSVAVLAKNIGQKILVNFYFNLIRLKTPTRLFTSESDAINWSLPYAKNNILNSNFVSK